MSDTRPVKASAVHLVDGTYELFRNHYGAPQRAAADGRAVGATVGLLRTLLALLREPGVTHVACAFDHVIESFRNDLFAGYKTSEGVPEELLAQFSLAERATHALGVVVWPMVEFEADDAVATAAHRFAPEVDRVVICSPDKDFAQCVRNGKVVCLDRRRKIVLDEAGVIGRFGVGPASIPDWLALVGDTADGIPGLSGFGARTASRLLARWARLEDVPAEARDWQVAIPGAERLAAVLRERRDDAFLYRTLARLRTDVPLVEDLEGLRWQGPRSEELEDLCSELAVRDFFETVRGPGS